MSILKELGPNVVKNDKNLEKLSLQGGNKESLSKAAALAIPAILFGLWQKSQNQEEKAKIEDRLNKYETKSLPNGGAELDSYLDKVDRNQGQDILGDLFGNNKAEVSKDIADKSGVSQSEVDAVLEKLAPTVEAMLAKEKAAGRDIEEVTRQEMQEVEKDDNYDINDLLGPVLRKAGGSQADGLLGQLGGILGKFL